MSLKGSLVNPVAPCKYIPHLPYNSSFELAPNNKMLLLITKIGLGGRERNCAVTVIQFKDDELKNM